MTMRSACRAAPALLAGLGLALLAGAAQALPLRLEITGSVSRADGTGVFEAGDPVELVIVLDLELPLVLPDAFFAVSSASGSGTAGGGAITLTTGAITSWQISDGFTFDLGGIGPILGDSAFEAVELAPGVFEGADAAAFRALDAGDVRALRLRVRTTFESSSVPTRADVAVTQLLVTPEPSGAALVAAGLAGLAARRRRGRAA